MDSTGDVSAGASATLRMNADEAVQGILAIAGGVYKVSVTGCGGIT